MLLTVSANLTEKKVQITQILRPRYKLNWATNLDLIIK